MQTYRYKIVIEQDEDGIYIASCPSLQGCHAQGVTIHEARENIRDAIRLHIEAHREIGEEIPVEVLYDEVEVDV
jgi:antitoxin HicB